MHHNPFHDSIDDPTVYSKRLQRIDHEFEDEDGEDEIDVLWEYGNRLRYYLHVWVLVDVVYNN